MVDEYKGYHIKMNKNGKFVIIKDGVVVLDDLSSCDSAKSTIDRLVTKRPRM